MFHLRQKKKKVRVSISLSISAYSSTYIEEKLEHTFREVKQNCELVLGSREFLDASEMEKSRWQTAQLVLREIHLL